MDHPRTAIWLALAAAALFGVSTPLVKLLAGAIVFGGLLGPVLLVFGLARIDAGPASLTLNLKAVFTAVLAWVVFREYADRRIVIGMLLIVAGGVVLAWPTAASPPQDVIGLLAITAACLCWGIDNNLTRRVSGSDARFIAGTKGWTAGLVNTSLGMLVGTSLPTLATAGTTMLLGLAGYGLSLVLFVHALRGLGTARTGAYFSTAPFIGAAVAILLLKEPAPTQFWISAGLMGLGVWLHLTERHEHLHTHEPVEHTHRHVHDAHHQHAHDFEWDDREPHSHLHQHEPLTHKHPHVPDIHHRHRH
ncbi:DMT family transporter [Thiobacillus denitrificans]|uniref:DMT family transporter n=1 Tax=Thiobacillus denitrificans TaxID=36861 RepID=UPI000360D102|nr:DMT family transporter [Thiobacillus denitrificans]